MQAGKQQINIGSTSARLYRRRCVLFIAAWAPAVWTHHAAAQSTATWNGGIGNWSNPGLWSTNAVPNSGTTSVLIDGGNSGMNSTVTVDGKFLLNNLTVDSGDRLLFTAGQFGDPGPSIYGNATINGSVTLGGVGSLAYVKLLGTNATTFSGSGQLVLDQYGSLYNSTGMVLTLGPGLTTRNGTSGAGEFRNGALLNQGTIVSDLPAGSMNIATSSFTNAGTIQITNGGRLTFNAQASNNSGTVNVNNGTLDLRFAWHNSGLINAGASSTVNLDGTFAFTDIGSINRTAGSTINLVGLLANSGKTLSLDATTGSWNLLSGTIQGGTIAASGGAQLIIAYGGSPSPTFDGVTLATAPNFSGVPIGYRYSVGIRNGLVLSGGLSWQATNTTFNFYGTQTLGGTGSIDLGTGSTIYAGDYYNPNSVVTIGPSVLIHGSSAQLYGGYGGFLNQGTIRADLSPTSPSSSFSLVNVTNQASIIATGGGNLSPYGLTNAPSGTVAVNGGFLTLSGPWHNFGVINATNAVINLGDTFTSTDLGTINHFGTVVTNLTGTLLNAGQNLALNPTTGSWNLAGGTIQGGTVSASGGAQLIVPGGYGAVTLDGVTLATAPVFTTSSKQVTLLNGLTLAGGLSFPATNAVFTFLRNQTLGGSGSIDLGTGGAANVGDGSNPTAVLTIAPGVMIHSSAGSIASYLPTGGIVNQGTLRADTGNIVSGFRLQTPVTNIGHVEVAVGSQMFIGGNLANAFTQTAGELDVDGLFNSSGPTPLTLAGGILAGSGTVSLSSGTGSLSVGGILAPGHGVGKLTVLGNVTLTGGAHYAVELSGANSADLLAITGNLDLGTANDFLDVTPLNGVIDGHPYLVATYSGTLTGTFDNVTPFYQVTYALGQIFVTSTPEPAGLAFALLGVSCLIRRRRNQT